MQRKTWIYIKDEQRTALLIEEPAEGSGSCEKQGASRWLDARFSAALKSVTCHKNTEVKSCRFRAANWPLWDTSTDFLLFSLNLSFPVVDFSVLLKCFNLFYPGAPSFFLSHQTVSFFIPNLSSFSSVLLYRSNSTHCLFSVYDYSLCNCISSSVHWQQLHSNLESEVITRIPYW